MLDKHPSMVLQDEDKDNLDDRVEQQLAERYAPIIYHSSAETNFPTNVDWFLSKTSLMFYDDGCEPDKHILLKPRPSQRDLLNYVQSEGCDNYKMPVFSNKIRSKNKQYTFYLKDVHEQWRKGSLDTRDWTTYFHAFPNDIGGVTIQYWRFYAYNDAGNNHGGDWEGIFVVLDKEQKPTKIGFIGHTSISVENPSSVEWENGHPVVYSEGGGHASRPAGKGILANYCKQTLSPICTINKSDPSSNIRHETWTGGRVRWFDGKVSPSGKLINVGARTHPMNDQVFIQYSGLWGSPGRLYITSGYWGPAYNETGMNQKSSVHAYVPAWCSTMQGAYTNYDECWVYLCR